MTYSSNSSRRDFLRQMGMIGVGAAVGGLDTACRRGRKSLNLWGTGTLDIGDWGAFEENHGVGVVFEDNQNDPGPVITQLVQEGDSQYRHLSGLQGGAEAELAAADAIIPWDLNLIPRFSELWPWAQDIEYTVIEGERYGIPSVVNADSMIYLQDRVAVSSYESVFDPDLRGRTSMEDAWINSVIFTAIYLKENQLETIHNPGNLTESELRDVMRFLRDQAAQGQFRKLWRGWMDGVDLITSGEVWVMTGWEPIYYEARRRGVNVGYAVPREGYEGWSNDILLHPGAQKDGLYQTAHGFINWELGGLYGCELAMQRGYVVPTDETVQYAELHPEQFDPNAVSEVVENVKRKFFSMKGSVYWQNVRPANFQLYEEEWSRFRSMF